MKDRLLSRLIKWSKGRREPPFIIDLNPTDLCNLECKSCWQRKPEFQRLDSSYQLSDSLFLRVVEQAIELGVGEFEITGGGEPLMRKELVLTAMRKVKQSGLRGNLTTNGTLFAKKDLKTLTDLGWDQLTISLDGAEAETQDYLRGKQGTFARIMEAVQQLNEYKEEKDHDFPRLKFNCVISNRNYEQVTNLIDLAQELGAGEVSFETLTVHSSVGEKLKLNQEERQNFACEAEQAVQKAEDYKIETNLSELQESMLNKANQMTDFMRSEPASSFADLPCYEPWYHIVVKVDGSVNPCCLYDSQKANVRDKTLEEVWYGPTFENIRDRMRKGNLSDYCQICNAGQFERNQQIRQELESRLED